MKTTRRAARFGYCFALLAALIALPSAAHAWDLSGPSSGRWSVALFEHTWARGSAIWCTNVAPGTACTDSDLGGLDWDGPGDANDELSSYEICNNSGDTMAFHVTLYRDDDYRGLFDTQDFTVRNEECVIRNMSIDDVLSSFYVQPQRVPTP